MSQVTHVYLTVKTACSDVYPSQQYGLILKGAIAIYCYICKVSLSLFPACLHLTKKRKVSLAQSKQPVFSAWACCRRAESAEWSMCAHSWIRDRRLVKTSSSALDQGPKLCVVLISCLAWSSQVVLSRRVH